MINSQIVYRTIADDISYREYMFIVPSIVTFKPRFASEFRNDIIPGSKGDIFLNNFDDPFDKYEPTVAFLTLTKLIKLREEYGNFQITVTTEKDILKDNEYTLVEIYDKLTKYMNWLSAFNDPKYQDYLKKVNSLRSFLERSKNLILEKHPVLKEAMTDANEHLNKMLNMLEDTSSFNIIESTKKPNQVITKRDIDPNENINETLRNLQQRERSNTYSIG